MQWGALKYNRVTVIGRFARCSFCPIREQVYHTLYAGSVLSLSPSQAFTNCPSGALYPFMSKRCVNKIKIRILDAGFLAPTSVEPSLKHGRMRWAIHRSQEVHSYNSFAFLAYNCTQKMICWHSKAAIQGHNLSSSVAQSNRNDSILHFACSQQGDK